MTSNVSNDTGKYTKSPCCSCEKRTPSTPDYADTCEVLDTLLRAEAGARLLRRAQEKLPKENDRDRFLHRSVFEPPGHFSFNTVSQPLFMNNDNVIADIRARLMKERRNVAEEKAARELAEIAALELKCTLLQSRP